MHACTTIIIVTLCSCLKATIHQATFRQFIAIVGNELLSVCYKLPTICNLLPEVDPWSTSGSRLPER